jgi:hypothetical protein
LALQVACQQADPAQNLDPALQTAALNSLKGLIQTITQPDLKAAFLNQPLVQAVLSQISQKNIKFI